MVFWVRLLTSKEVPVPNTSEELLVAYQRQTRFSPAGSVAENVPVPPEHTEELLAIGALGLAATMAVAGVLPLSQPLLFNALT